MITPAAYNRNFLVFTVVFAFSILISCLAAQPIHAEDAPAFFINDDLHPVTVQVGTTAGEWLVSLREFAEQTGLVIGWLEESKTVRIKDTTVIAYLQVGSDVALINSEEHYLAEPLQLSDGRLMVPLSFLSQAFGYEALINADRIEVSIPSELISGINTTILDGRPVVSIRTSSLPRFETHLLTSPDRIVVDFYDTRIDLNGAFQGEIPSDSAIQGIRWHQFKPNIARVVIDLSRSVGFEVTPALDGKGISISLYRQVQNVSFQRIFGRAQLDVKGSGPLNYSVTYLHGPERLVIDLEKATLAVPMQEIELEDPLVKKIRVNQFLPHIVRAVLELKYPAGAVTTPTADANTLLFELVKKVTGVQVAPVDGRRAFLIQGAGIDEYAVEYFPDLAQILVDIPSATLATDQPRLTFDQGPVSDVKLLQVAPTSVQVQIGLRGYRGHEVVRDARGVRVLINDSPLAGRKIVIDPGHGGQDPGAIGQTGLMEKDVVLDIGLRLRDLLQDQGAEVIMVREDDSYVSLLERASLARKHSAEVFVSIHVNSSMNTAANGTETYYYYTDPKAQEMATLIQREILSGLELSNRAPRPNRDFVVLKENTVPAVLTEVAFISNKAEEKLMKQSDFRQNAAEAIFRGLVAYFAGPSWQFREILTTPIPPAKHQEFLAPPVEPKGEINSGEEFTWEQINVNPDKPGAGIVDKVNVIQIQ